MIRLHPNVWLWLAALLCLLRAPPAQAERTELKYMKVELDDRPADVGPLVLDGDSCLVPLGKAVKVLSQGRAEPDADNARPYRITAAGRVVLQLPTMAGDNTALLLGTRKVRLDDPPEMVTLPGRTPQLMIDLKTLAGLLGITLDRDGMTYRLHTPEYWCRKINIGERATEGRTFRNLALLPDVGVSPPARSLLVWVRPAEKGYVQIYKLSEGTPEPMLGVNNFGSPVSSPHPPFETPRMRAADPGRPLRVDTRFYGTDPRAKARGYGSYVAVVTRTDLKDRDPVQAINQGEIADDDWCIVGIRQVVASAVIRYEPYVLRQGDTLKGVAAKFRMPVSLLRNLNGLREGDSLHEGESVAVIAGLDEGALKRARQTDFVVTGLYEAKPNDTLQSLARRCGVTVEDFLAANTALPRGAELEPGEVVSLLRPKQRKQPLPTAPKPDVQAKCGTVKTRMATVLRKHSGPNAPVLARLPANTPVMVLGKAANGSQYWVSVGDLTGCVPLGAMAAFRPAPPPGPASAGGSRVVAEALRWLGVPRYQMGGADLASAIDCSHFVSAVFAQARQPAPDPPVHNQEMYGSIVHWKPGLAEENGKILRFDHAASFANLRPGDRVIFQNDPANSGYQGNHHTGIYIGRYGTLNNAVVHCNASAGTVSVNDLTGRLWRIYRYCVRGTQRRAAGQYARGK